MGVGSGSPIRPEREGLGGVVGSLSRTPKLKLWPMGLVENGLVGVVG